jgi:hypothetical protein
VISDIILIGPIGAGKSTLAARLAERLGVPRCAMDVERWPYMQEAGYDPAVADQIKKRDKHYRNVFAYWKQFEAHMVERLLAEHRGQVVDFGASQSVYEDEADFARVQAALADYANVVLVLPAPDPAESLRVLKARVWDGVAGGFDFQAHFVMHPSNRRLATLTVYTESSTPDETCNEILRRLPLPFNVPNTQEKTP